MMPVTANQMPGTDGEGRCLRVVAASGLKCCRSDPDADQVQDQVADERGREVADLRLLRRWVEHMRAAGFEVEVQDVPGSTPAALKRRVGLAPEQMSCHGSGLRLLRRGPYSRRGRETSSDRTSRGARACRARRAGRLARYGDGQHVRPL